MAKKIGKKIVADLKKRSEKSLELAKQILQREKIEDSTLCEALKHYLTNWNDFTHPGLFSLACEAVEGKPDDAVYAQAAITMMAAAFDIHDDIIDKSETKHKIPTVYGKFGTEVALLLGNAFLTEGFRLLVNSVEVLPRQKAGWILETVKKLIFEVGNAHAIEVSLRRRKSVVPDEYMRIVEMKAAATELDMFLGAVFGNGEENEIHILSKLGRIIGTLATLREEFIDVFEIEELRNRVNTGNLPLPLLFAIQDVEIERKVTEIISKPNINQNDIDLLLDFSLETTPVIRLKRKMQTLIDEGLNLINHLPIQNAIRQLQNLLAFMLEDL